MAKLLDSCWKRDDDGGQHLDLDGDDGRVRPGERDGAEERRAMGESERGQWVCVEML